ncbi:MAG TPA: hypothetical protein ENJ18_12775 [Nannocystis exedens]|nr:hypothetical protein [Nannocystis exedens]
MWKLALLTTAILSVAACKAGQGDACRCASDCKSDLQCAAEGYKALSVDNCSSPGEGEGCCYPAGAAGICVLPSEADNFDSSASAVDPTVDGYPDNKRDFGIDSSASDSGSTSTTDASTSSGTSTSTSTSAGSSTTDASTSSGTSTSTSTGSSTTDASTSSGSSTTEMTGTT